MTSQTFIVRSQAIRAQAAKAVLAITEAPLMEVIVREHVSTRTDAQNRHYWFSLGEELRQLNESIHQIANQTGHTPLEVRRFVAADLAPEQVAILYASSSEAAHEVLKLIHGIPTSTRLGTKAFMAFEERMIQTVAEVVGAVRAAQREAA